MRFLLFIFAALVLAAMGGGDGVGAAGLDGTPLAPAPNSTAQAQVQAPRPVIDAWGGVAVGGGLMGAAAVVLYALQTTQNLRTRVAKEIRLEIAEQEKAERGRQIPQPLETKTAPEYATREDLDELREELKETRALAQTVAGLTKSIEHVSKGLENIEILLMSKGGCK